MTSSKSSSQLRLNLLTVVEEEKKNHRLMTNLTLSSYKWTLYCPLILTSSYTLFAYFMYSLIILDL